MNGVRQSVTFLFLVVVTTQPLFSEERPQIVLWEQGAPGAIGSEPNDRPNLTVYAPPADQNTGCGLLVIPGGGYGSLAIGHEGDEIGHFFQKQGVTAFVLRYRIAPRYKHPAPLQDAQRALRTIRARATEWNVDPNRIGVMGFSAGGHLASTLATHFDPGQKDHADVIEQASCRPDFAILCYPVITLSDDNVTHKGSRKNLLGDNPDPKLLEELSNDRKVTAETPPTFLFHTTEDVVVPPENSVLFYLALRRAGIPAELHIYETGRHGVGLATAFPAVKSWPDRMLDWLNLHQLLQKKS